MSTSDTVRRRRYERCAAPGCIHTPRKYSRYCRHHYAKLERTRSLRGRIVTKGELKANREDCSQFIRRNGSHPAVTAALRYMADLLEPTERATFLQKEFARLRAAGATPDAMLASAMALYMWAERQPEWNRLEDRAFNLNLGRAVLNTVPAAVRATRKGKRYYVRISPGHAEAFGENLKAAVGLLCLLAVQKMLKDSGWYAADVRGRLIREAIESEPLDEAALNSTAPR